MLTCYLVAALFVVALACCVTARMDDERPMWTGMFVALLIVFSYFL